MKWCLILLVTVSLSSCATVYKPQPSGSLEADLQAVTDYYAGRDNRVGLGFLYHSPDLGSLSAASGYRDVSRTARLTISDIYELGSTTKLFVATVVLQLAEEGLLALDDPLSRFGFAFPGAGKISVKDLLQHTSGIPDYFGNQRLLATEEDYLKERTEEELLELGLSAPPVRGAWSYSNTNYVLLGLVIRQVTGNAAAKEIRDRILTPLGMTSTFFRGKEEVEGEVALGYAHSSQGGYWDAWNGINPQIFSYAGCMVSTPEEVLRFLRALFEGGLLQEGSLQAMKEFIPATDRFDYGLGLIRLQLLGRRAIGHGGATLGTISFAFYCEETGEYFVFYTTLKNDNLRGFEESLRLVLDHAAAP